MRRALLLDGFGHEGPQRALTRLLGLLALAMTPIILTGGIDLSAGSMVAFSATTCALLLTVFSEVDDRRLVTVGNLGIAAAIGGALLSGLLWVAGVGSGRF